MRCKGCIDRNGAVKLLTRDAPTLLVEAEDRHRTAAVASVRQFLEGLNYEGLFLLEGKLLPIDCFDSFIYQNVDNLTDCRNTRAHSPYINNLIFVSRANYAARERIAPWRLT